jgi:molybdate transport system substrate-binding protein
MPAQRTPLITTLATLLCLCLAPLAHAADTVTVFAAASLTDALGAIGKAYEATHPVRIRASFASSGTLAKQIDAGAPAEIFASADRKWMDMLALHQHIEAGSRYELLGNTLVLIAPRASTPGPVVTFSKDSNFPASFKGKLCTGETASVPAGIYAKQALQSLGWWDGLQGRIVGAEDVRSALAFVERGECDFGIVYQTDALISDKVVVAGRFPDNSHAPIIYPIALVPGASPEARDYFRYLQSDAARAVFARYGFALH